MPWPVAKLPFGHMDAHPRRLQDEQGIVLSHLSLRRRHSAQDMAPLARLNSCSWARAASLSFGTAARVLVRAAWGMVRGRGGLVGGGSRGAAGEGEAVTGDRAGRRARCRA